MSPVRRTLGSKLDGSSGYEEMRIWRFDICVVMMFRSLEQWRPKVDDSTLPEAAHGVCTWRISVGQWRWEHSVKAEWG